MSPSNKVNIVRGDDWEVVYVNGMKLLEGHSVSLESLLNVLRVPFETHEMDAEDYPDVWPDDSGA